MKNKYYKLIAGVFFVTLAFQFQVNAQDWDGIWDGGGTGYYNGYEGGGVSDYGSVNELFGGDSSSYQTGYSGGGVSDYGSFNPYSTGGLSEYGYSNLFNINNGGVSDYEYGYKSSGDTDYSYTNDYSDLGGVSNYSNEYNSSVDYSENNGYKLSTDYNDVGYNASVDYGTDSSYNYTSDYGSSYPQDSYYSYDTGGYSNGGYGSNYGGGNYGGGSGYSSPSYSTPVTSKPIYFAGQPIYIPSQQKPIYYPTPTPSYPTPSYPTVCTVNIYPQSTTVSKGQAVKLTWNSTNAVKVVFNGGTISNKTVALNGTYTVYPYSSTTYTATCYSKSGQTNYASAYVNVNVPYVTPVINPPVVYNTPTYSYSNFSYPTPVQTASYAYAYSNTTNYNNVPYLGYDYPPAPKKKTYTYVAPKKTYTVKKTTTVKKAVAPAKKVTGQCVCVENNMVLFGIKNISGGIIAGSQVKYGVGIKNIASSTLANVVIRVELPEGLLVNSSDTGTAIKGSKLFVVNIGDLKAGEVKQFILKADANSSLANSQTILVNAYANFTITDEALTIANRQKEVSAYTSSKVGVMDQQISQNGNSSSNVDVTVNNNTTSSSSSLYTLLTSGWVGWLMILLGIVVLFFVFRFVLSLLIPRE